MKHELMKLPYAHDALEPHMSKETLTYHHDKHHQTYVNKLNDLIVGTKFEEMELVQIIQEADGGIFNNAAQIYNHDFFWYGLTPNEVKMSEELEKILTDTFGSVDAFKKAFISKAITHFGSGWIWLVVDGSEKLQIISTPNADTPLTDGLIPLLTADVWEHAYYIDYRNVRPEYLEHWWSLINWDFVSTNLEKS